MIDLNTKKVNGIFYTDNKDISYFIFSVINIDDLKNCPDIKILEPSCGDGTLILNIMEIIYNKYGEVTLLWFLKSLYFNDILKFSVDKCIENIKYKFELLTNKKIDFKLNWFNEDFVNKNNILMNLKFDYIIGNPPYVSYYGRRSVKKTEELRNKYLKEYKQFQGVKNGKLNLTMLFIENSLDILKVNGKLSFVLDGNFSEKPYFLTRKYIENINCNINKIIKNISCFSGVASGQIIVEIVKNIRSKKESKIKVIDYQSKKKWLINNYSIKSEKNYKLNLENLTSKILNILNKVNKKTSIYKSIYPKKTLRTSSMLLNLEDNFVSNKLNNSELNNNEFYYYKGSKSLQEKFIIKSTNKILTYDKNKSDLINNEIKFKLISEGIKNKKRIMLGDKFSFSYPKIFIRQSSKQIMTALDFNKSTSNNSLYMICSNEKFIFSNDELLFLTGYLNSDIITFFAQKNNIIRFFKGKQPQISISDLHLLPIITNDNVKNEISKITNQIINKEICKNYGSKKINLIIYSFFNITKSEIEKIEKEINLF